MNENKKTSETSAPIHWADAMARKIVNEKGERSLYTCAAGITPSGTVHLGNFREIITVDLVVRALKRLGKQVRFIYSWDDFDVFRKVPLNMPHQEVLENYLRFPITKVPDTTGRDENYARHHEKDVETELVKVGIFPEFLYQASRYEANMYASGMQKALQNRALIKECLNEYRDENHKMKDSDDYWPISIFCSKCEKDTTKVISFDGEWKVKYECMSCKNSETVDLRSFKGAKLGWRIDWPMRWAREKVLFEPGGKDHISPGGSYDTAKLVSKKVYDWDAPVTMRYDFINLKGVPGKMSSSKGKVIALSDALEVYQAEVLRYLFASTRPNTEFSISFDLDVLKVYEDYDKTERLVYGLEKAKNDQQLAHEKRIYELSQVDGTVLPKMPKQVTFRLLTTLIQIFKPSVTSDSGDADALRKEVIEKVIATFGDLNESEKERLERRAACAYYWILNSAPTFAPDFCFELRSETDKIDYSLFENEPEKEKIFRAIRRVREVVLPKIDTFLSDKECQEAIYEVAKEAEIEPKMLFTGLYISLVRKQSGPRLGGFFRIIGREKLEKLLSEF